SVGVATPVKITTRIRGGSANAGAACLKTCTARASPGQPADRGRLRRTDTIAMATIRPRPISRPGTTPARNSAPTETLARLPKITKGMLGGMIGPMVADTALIVAE